MTTQKEINEIRREARSQGWLVEPTSGGHWRFDPPDKTQGPCFAPTSPSDWRGIRNLRAQLRRRGFRDRRHK